MTRAQARALREAAPLYLRRAEQLQFADRTPVGVEIGFGMGESLFDWAQAEPGWMLLGIELYQPGIGALSERLRQHNISNVSIIEEPAQQVMQKLPAAGVQQVRIYFPDPWPKKRHFKRRLIQPAFVAALARVLKDGGEVHAATDWAPYAEWMRECFAGHAAFDFELDLVRQPLDSAAGAVPEAVPPQRSPQPAQWARRQTKFERRGERLGNPICDLVLVRRPR